MKPVLIIRQAGKKLGKDLQMGSESVKMIVRNGWLSCPNCGNKRLLRLEAETEARRLPVYCRGCKTEFILDITRGRSVERRSR